MKLFNVNYTYKCFGEKQKHTTTMLGHSVADVKRALKTNLLNGGLIKDIKFISCTVNKDESKAEQVAYMNSKRTRHYASDTLVWKRQYGGAL